MTAGAGESGVIFIRNAEVHASEALGRELLAEQRLLPSEALRTMTSNGADAIGLAARNRRIALGRDADLIVFEGWRIRQVFAHGALVADDGVPVRRGMLDDILLAQLR